MLLAAIHVEEELRIMNEHTNEIAVDTAIAAELFAQLPVATQDALIDLIRSLLSEK
jgi:hypothetical protein